MQSAQQLQEEQKALIEQVIEELARLDLETAQQSPGGHSAHSQP